MQNDVELTPPPADGPLARKNGPWNDRIGYFENGSSAFRPNQIVCLDPDTVAVARSVVEKLTGEVPAEVPITKTSTLVVTGIDFDVEAALDAIRSSGGNCEPNYVLFAHAGAPSTPLDCWCGCCSGDSGLAANPFFANSVQANPFFANSVQANPFFANPFFANPFFANPFFANPFFANPFFANMKEDGVRPSTAIPVGKPKAAALAAPPGPARIIVLDTGIADTALLPGLLPTTRFASRFAADIDPPDEDGNKYLDPASGHGTFVAGVVEQIAPEHEVFVFSVLTSQGDGDVATIANRINLLITDGLINEFTIVNMSFGSYADDDMQLLVEAVAALQKNGAVVVASAGNDGTCRPSYPACLPDVVSVGSIDPSGPAFYSNHGPWVRACAPGTGVISSFYNEFEGAMVPVPGATDPDNYNEWAQWTGTSFAAPIVTAAIALQMARTTSTAETAVEEIIDAPGLFRHQGLGTVINLVPGI